MLKETEPTFEDYFRLLAQWTDVMVGAADVLADEAERVSLAAKDDGHTYVHLDCAIANVRAATKLNPRRRPSRPPACSAVPPPLS